VRALRVSQKQDDVGVSETKSGPLGEGGVALEEGSFVAGLFVVQVLVATILSGVCPKFLLKKYGDTNYKVEENTKKGKTSSVSG